MRRFWPLLAIALAGALGWWVAPPASVSQMGGELGLGDLGTVAAGEASADIASQLETIYTRKVWSSRNPTELTEAATEGEGGGETAAKSPALEGLDRFRLLGVIRVGGQPEALLQDQGITAGTDTDLPQVLRASPGDRLNDTAVTLARIEDRRAQLILGEQSRWISLYRDYKSFADEPGSQPSNELNN